jgi:hypothetical protein
MIEHAELNDYRPDPWRNRADVAVVSRKGDAMAAVLAAVKLRREGVSVATQLSGSFKKQMKRAHDLAEQTIVIPV